MNLPTRRVAACAGLLVMVLCGVTAGQSTGRAAAATSQPDPYFATLRQAWTAAGFDPAVEGSAFFVAVSDMHYPTGEKWLPRIVEEINAIQPRPKFFMITGDMIHSASIGPGRTPTPEQLAAARKEYAAIARDIARLHADVPFGPVIGNHDTYPGDDRRSLFHEVWPDRPTRQAFDCGGATVLIVDGGPFGRLEPEQRDWARKQLANVPRDRTVIVAVHQPSGGILAERSVGLTVSDLLSEFTGQAWMICGHAHRNAVACISLPRTTLVRAVITTGNGSMWGTDRPGYWVWCLRDGRVVARIYRHLDKGYRIDAEPDRSTARPLPQPFAGVPDRLWTMLVGENDSPCRVRTDAIDYGDAWIKMDELVFRLPLGTLDGRAGRLAILGDLDSADPQTPIRVAVSGDGRTWLELTTPRPAGHVYTFDLPASVRDSERLFVRITGSVKANGLVAGMALCR